MEKVNAKRIVREGTMRLPATPKRVFPLLCPVREYEWIDTWKARIVYTDSGVAEERCVFTTKELHGRESVWTVSRYEPEAGRIEFVVVTPKLFVMKLEIALQATGEETLARWTRVFTALSRAGERAMEAFHQEAYADRMSRLEAQLSHYLCSGEMLRS